ncbi:MarR family winged helix-turn-helix transcriptional regulator [Burkholderia alba]|uniref:MarR family winged helix-turn-helix transcriptional regulator n=1 Tax=Burkholderia alba TaxID=2683677 RepID=UPI002B05F05C|nr:MarR family winged helix-turn-helix transcriptional regulator [Burkholderia alba]
MANKVTSYNAHAVDRLIGEIFRLYGAVVAAGDVITRPFGLSSARWQVMGAIEATSGATVSALARQVGVTRQSVQRIVTEMAIEGYFELVDNPSDRRARIVTMTGKGWHVYDAVTAAWKATAEQMDQRFGPDALVRITNQLIELHDDFRNIAEGGNTDNGSIK